MIKLFKSFKIQVLKKCKINLKFQIEIAQTICLGLVALQHRGQESAGIVTSEGICSKNFNVYKGMGMINTIFNDEAIRKLKGNLGIGHTRYSTSASSEEVNCQPFVVHTAHGAMAVAHNGELVNCESLRRNVLERGVGLSTHSDSELITQALCLNPPEGEVCINFFEFFVFWKISRSLISYYQYFLIKFSSVFFTGRWT